MAAVVITRPNGESLTLDGAIREIHSRANRVSDHPVESGATVTDHIQRLPLELTISAIWTETPLDTRVGSLPAGEERVREVVRFLESISGEVVDVTTSRLGTYTSMALVRWPHQISGRRDLPVELGFREVQIAETQLVLIPPGNTSSPSATDEQDAGQQSTQDAPEEYKSSAASLYDWMVGGR